MKRCPQCDFIYEDDQSLCDMDGVLLVLDSRTLPNQQALVTTKSAKPKQRRKRAVPAFASLILVAVLGVVYFASTQQQEAESSYSAPAATTSAAPVSQVNPTPQVEQVQPIEAPKPDEARIEEKSAASKPSAAAQPARKSNVKAASVTPTNSPAKKDDSKDDSKVGSILKKTGRILKKPFKL